MENILTSDSCYHILVFIEKVGHHAMKKKHKSVSQKDSCHEDPPPSAEVRTILLDIEARDLGCDASASSKLSDMVFSGNVLIFLIRGPLLWYNGKHPQTLNQEKQREGIYGWFWPLKFEETTDSEDKKGNKK